MRPMYIIGAAIAVLALVGTLAWTRLAPAQQPPSPLIPGEKKVITVPDVEVRSGPSEQFYVTSKLRRGDEVQIVTGAKSNPGWLAIKPPNGSLSLVEVKFVKVDPNKQSSGVIDVPNSVPVRPASLLPVKDTNVETAKLETGAQVVIMGPPVLDLTRVSWYAIQPPDGDVRYIPESAVARANPIQQTGAQVQSGFVAPPGGPTLLSQADKQLDQVKDLYRLAAGSNDPNESRAARQKLQTLEQTQVPLGQPGYPNNTAQSPGTAPRVTLMGTQVSQTSGSGSTALYQTTAQTTGALQWSAWGTLRKTSIPLKDGQPVFRLEDDRGVPVGYAVAAPGYTLETYVGQKCCLYGAVTYRSDDVLRGNVTVVSQIALQPAR
jgi:hypothetical protein